MSYTADISDAYLYWDNVESGSLQVQQTAEASYLGSSVNIAIAKRSMPTEAEQAFSNAGVPVVDIAWSLPAALLGDVVPKKGNQFVTNSGQRFSVISVTEQRMGSSLSHYRCACKGVSSHA